MVIHTASLLIKASPEKVFDVLTNPELVKLWQFGKIVSCDWRSGHEIKFTVEFEGKFLVQHGKILEIRKNEFLKYNLFTPKEGLEDKPENYNVTAYRLTTENNFTRVEIIHEDKGAMLLEPISLLPILTELKKAVESLKV